MKKNYLFLVLVATIAFNATLTNADSFALNAPTPQQMYQSVSQTNIPAQNIVPANAATTSASLDALNKQFINYQQQSEQQLAELSDKNRSLSDQLQGVNQIIMMLNQQMTQLHATQERLMALMSLRNIPSASVNTLWNQWLSWVKNLDFVAYINFAGALIFLIGIGVLIGRLTRKIAKQPLQSCSDTASDRIENEYDFMETNNATPALLDLARSYLAMDNLNQAKTVLQKVVQRGNVTERKEAQDLIDKINEKTKC